jgi:hypothetical protein
LKRRFRAPAAPNDIFAAENDQALHFPQQTILLNKCGAIIISLILSSSVLSLFTVRTITNNASSPV